MPFEKSNYTNRGTAHVDAPLTNFSLRYSNGSLIADAVCPRVGVKKESDVYYIFGKENFRRRKSIRADKADPNFVAAFTASTTNYRCEEYELADLVSDRERRNADDPVKPDQTVTNNLTDMLMIERELRVASSYTTIASWGDLSTSNGTTLSGVHQWDNASLAAGSIEEDIDAAKEVIRAGIGRDPNTIIIPSAVSRVVKRNSSIRELIKYTQSNLLVNGDLPPTMFNMRVLIPGGVYDSAEEGQTASLADVWGKHVVLLYLDPSPMSLQVMTAAVTMEAQARKVSKWREEGRKSDAIEVAEILTEKIVGPYCGYVIRAAIS